MSSQPTRAIPLPPAERREALIEATIPLLMSKGTGVTTKQLAEACGVAEGTLFRVFPDKDSLIEAAIGRAFDPAPVIAELAAVDQETPLQERLTEVVRILTARFTRTMALLNAVRLGGGDPRPVISRIARRGRPEDASAETDFQRIHTLIITAIADVIAEDADQLRCTPMEAGRLLRMLVFSGIHPGISGGPPLSEEQIIDFLLNGVRRHPC
jgi:AcrR family transcriptional regulator